MKDEQRECIYLMYSLKSGTECTIIETTLLLIECLLNMIWPSVIVGAFTVDACYNGQSSSFTNAWAQESMFPEWFRG